MIYYLIISCYFMFILSIVKVTMIELTRRQVEKRNLGFRYYLSYAGEFIYRKPVVIVFFCVFMYGNTSIETAFSMLWFLELSVFMATMVLADMGSQFLSFKYAKKRFNSKIKESVDFSKNIDSLLNEDCNLDYYVDQKNYSLKDTCSKFIEPNSHIAIMGFQLKKIVPDLISDSNVVYLLDQNNEISDNDFNNSNYKVVSKVDGYKLPFKDNRLDCIVCFFDLYDIEELYRVLKPGGILIVEQAGSQHINKIINLVSPRLASKSTWTMEEVLGDFMAEGFDNVESTDFIGDIKFSSLAQFKKYAIDNLQMNTDNVTAYLHVYYSMLNCIKNDGVFIDKTHSVLLTLKKNGEKDDE